MHTSSSGSCRQLPYDPFTKTLAKIRKQTMLPGASRCSQSAQLWHFRLQCG